MEIHLDKKIADEAWAQEAQSIVRKCVHCGFCNATCPTYQLLGHESDGPRGRIYLITQLLEGHPADEATRAHLDRCLLCRACETTCPSGVPYARLLETGRHMLDQDMPRTGLDDLKRKLMTTLIPNRQLVAYRDKPGQTNPPLVTGRCFQPTSVAWQRPVATGSHPLTQNVVTGGLCPIQSDTGNQCGHCTYFERV